jgi:hypothetical protein
VPQEPAATDSRSISTIEARDVDHPARAGKALSEAIADQRRRLTAVPFDPSPIGRDNVPSMSNDPPSVAPDRAAKHVLSALTDRASVSTSPAAADLPIERDLPVALARGGANDPGSAGLSPADSSSMAGPWSQAARMPLADTAAGARQRAWKPESDSELADSLFETLYRDGVDLPWP